MAEDEHKQKTEEAHEAATDAAVDDITKHDADEALAVQDAKHFDAPKLPWYKKILAEKKLWIPLAVVLVLIIVFALPFTRYKLIGLVWKQTYTVAVTDSQTKLPVSDATVALNGSSTTTDNKGHAKLKVSVGSKKLTITKKYYTTLSRGVVVGLHPKAVEAFQIQATGRQVPLKVVDLISGLPASNVEVSAAGTSVKTDKNGQVTMVLPADQTKVTATLGGSGFNNASVTIQVTGSVVPANTFKVTPSGTVYFLSNASGKVDVVSTNLDGTNRQTVLAGTGNEDPQNTSLLASRDWKYLALNAKRDTSTTSNSIYLIDTSTNKLATMDVGNATFTPIGWSGHYFVYEVDRPNVQSWQSNAVSFKSYNADTGKLTTLFSTSATGTSNADAQYQSVFSNFLFNDNLVFTTTWYQYPGYLDVNGQTDQLISIHPDGTDKQILKSVDAGSSYITDEVVVNPNELYFDVQSQSTNTSTAYQVNANNAVTQTTTNDNILSQTYPTYLVSPTGDQTFWGEPRDGKTTLFVGDAEGNNGKQIAALSDYTPYGWYSDNYVLVEKDSSELYIMPAGGGNALKVSDYYKPAQNFNGYGGGYGGL